MSHLSSGGRSSPSPFTNSGHTTPFDNNTPLPTQSFNPQFPLDPVLSGAYYPSLETLRSKYPVVQKLYNDYQARCTAFNQSSQKVLSLLDNIERLTQECKKLENLLQNTDGIYQYHPSLRSSQPARRPNEFPVEILWQIEDCKADPAAAPTKANPSRPHLESCIRQADGTIVAPEEFALIKKTTASAFAAHLKQFRETMLGMGPRHWNSRRLRSEQPEAWGQTVRMIEQAHPVVALCNASWKAAQLIQYHIQNGSATDVKRSKRNEARGLQREAQHNQNGNEAAAASSQAASSSSPSSPNAPSRPCSSIASAQPPPNDNSSIDPSLLHTEDISQQPPTCAAKRRQPDSDSDLPQDRHATSKRVRTCDEEDDLNSPIQVLDIPQGPKPLSRVHDAFLNILPSNENIQDILQNDFPELKGAGIKLLQRMARAPALPTTHQPSDIVIAFISRIEGADYSAPDISEDENNQSWGHYQFTGGSMTVGSVLTSWDTIGHQTALRLLAASIKTCRAARLLCTKNSITTTSYVSDAYLERVIEQLGGLLEEYDSASASQPPNNTEVDAASSPGITGSPVPSTGDLLKVSELKHWAAEMKISYPPKGRVAKQTLVDTILQSGNVPSAERIAEYKRNRLKPS